MNQKYVAAIIIIAGVLIGAFTYIEKVREDKAIDQIITAQGGSCYLPDGTCLHEDRNWTPYIVGGILTGALLILGLYLLLIDKTQEHIMKHQHDVSHALADAKKHEKETHEFDAFLSAFTEDEQKVVKAVHEQEGIKQSTLRYKIGLSKTGLSLMLKSLEERKIISRKVSGKTNEVYLRKKF